MFGSASRLVGVLTEPAGGGRRDPAFVFLNAGVVHRVGPNRTYVRLARALAEAGYASLRFDLSGVGDSEVRSDQLSFSESSLIEAREAMDYLARVRSASQFVLAGICSGAALAFGTATADGRVAGVVLIDGYAYPTSGYRVRTYLHHYGRLFTLGAWRRTWKGTNRLGRRLHRLIGRTPRPRVVQAELVNAAGGEGAGIPPREATAAVLRTLVARGLQLCVVFSGGQTVFNYRGQIADAFPDVPFGRQLSVSYFPESDHTFPRQPHQRRLTDAVLRWADERFSAPAAAGAPAAEPPSRARTGSGK
jgi:pimeloyl-ACP methyl ester carboxylesterase